MDTPSSIAATLRDAANSVEQWDADQDAIIATVGAHGVVHVRPADGLLGDRPQDTEVLWDFGDPTSPRNQLPGFNAAHRYRTPGHYTVTLSIRTNAAIRVFRCYVDIDLAPPQSVISDIPERLGDNTTLVLQRGTVQRIDRPIIVDGDHIEIIADGEGKPPILLWAGGDGPMIRCSPSCKDVLIDGIAFDSEGKRGDRFALPTALSAAGRNIVIINCTFGQVQDAINGNGKPVGLLVQQCEAGDDLHAYFAWLEGQDIVLLDNIATHSIDEHIVRVGGATRILAVGNRFTNRRKSCFNVQVAEQVWLERNIVRGAWALGPLGGGDGRTPSDRCRVAVVRDNDADTTLQLKHGAEAIRVRSNLLRVDANPAIEIEGFSADFDRGVRDVELLDNTAVNLTEHGSFLRIGGRAFGINVIGNRYLAPHLRPGSHQTAVLFILDDTADAIVDDIDNDWPETRGRNRKFAGDGLHYVWPTWSDQRGYVRSLGKKVRPRQQNEREHDRHQR